MGCRENNGRLGDTLEVELTGCVDRLDECVRDREELGMMPLCGGLMRTG